jgi:hypothetical protein
MSKRIPQEVEGSNAFGDLVGLTFASTDIVLIVDHSDD